MDDDDIVRLPNSQAPVGQIAFQPNGDKLLVGFDGRILAGADADNVPIDDLDERYPPYAYRVGPEVERQAVRERRLVQLEERFAPAPEFEPEPEPESEYEAVIDQDALDAQDIYAKVSREEARRGHPFTHHELEGILTRAREDLDAGREVDVRAIVSDMTEQGEAPLGLDNRQERRDWIVSRLADGDRERRGQELGEPDPPVRVFSDPDDRQERIDWQVDAIHGRAGVENLYPAEAEG